MGKKKSSGEVRYVPLLFSDYHLIIKHLSPKKRLRFFDTFFDYGFYFLEPPSDYDFYNLIKEHIDNHHQFLKDKAETGKKNLEIVNEKKRKEKAKSNQVDASKAVPAKDSGPDPSYYGGNYKKTYD